MLALVRDEAAQAPALLVLALVAPGSSHRAPARVWAESFLVVAWQARSAPARSMRWCPSLRSWTAETCACAHYLSFAAGI